MKKSEDIIRFAKDGKSIQEIAKLLGYKSTSHVSRVLRKNNQPVRHVCEAGEKLHTLLQANNYSLTLTEPMMSGDRYWELHGKLHRENGPALELCAKGRLRRPKATTMPWVGIKGGRFWFRHGYLHREDGPAREYVSGIRHWYLHGKHHREDGPAVEYPDGIRHWYLHGKQHREDGPACEYPDGTREWYLHGKQHREDGPAYEGADGSRQWYWHGELAYVRSRKDLVRSQEEFNEWLIQEVQES